MRIIRPRRLLSAGALVVAFTALATVGVGASSAPPAFAGGCWGDSCTGQDPEAQGCSAQTIDSVYPPGGGSLVELRQSSDCYAAWARAAGGWNILVQGSTTPDGSNIVVQYGAVGGDPATGVEWTDMVSFGYWTRACIEGIDSSDWNCTGWH